MGELDHRASVRTHEKNPGFAAVLLRFILPKHGARGMVVHCI